MGESSRRNSRTGRLFSEPQGDFFEKSAEDAAREDLATSVECLGMTFDNEDARRSHFLAQLQDHLGNPEFTQIAGFPRGSTDEILRISDPPYYTACPNPFLSTVIDYHLAAGTLPPSQRSVEPFAADVSEGKNDPLYQAFSYHAKVPPRAVSRYVQHYAPPGGVVLDVFCGSGMTGLGCALAAQQDGEPPRLAVLNDLAPAASFVADMLNRGFPPGSLQALSELVDSAESSCKQLYEWGSDKGDTALYTVWSEVFRCPHCASEIVLWDSALDSEAGRVREQVICEVCAAASTKRSLERATETYFDSLLDKAVTRTKIVPVEVDISGPKGRRRLRLAKDEREALRFDYGEAPDGQTFPMAFRAGRWGDQYREGYHLGMTHSHQFYTARNFIALSTLRRLAVECPFPREGLALLVAIAQDCSRLARVKVNYYFKGGGGAFDPGLSGTLYLPSFSVEKNPFFSARNRLATIKRALRTRPRSRCVTSTGSSTSMQLPKDAVDYCFIDPPFGDNLAYSELNFLAESWLRVFTNQEEEAIISRVQQKDLTAYGDLMTRSFIACHAALRPEHWMTVEFSNTRASVWNAIQLSLERSGFVVATVTALDKRQRTFNALVTPTSVKQDLAISAYKPALGDGVDDAGAGGESFGAMEFVYQHLRHLPVFAGSEDTAMEIPERSARVLFDRMVAWFVQRGTPVPLSSGDFRLELDQRLAERDGMYFLPEQVAEYDRKRAGVGEMKQLSLFVKDEASAIHWAQQLLRRKPQGFQDLQPQFMKELHAWAKHEQTVELKQILIENFLCYEGHGPVPAQIHSYLSTNFKDCRNLEKSDAILVEKARGRWYVPDPAKQGDLEQIRSRRLLAEFEEYRSAKSKKLKQFRTEAIRAGFSAAWNAKDFQAIVDVAKKIPDSVLQEDADLLMYYDNATTLLGTD